MSLEAEALLATTGILSPELVTRDDVRAAEGLPGRWADRISHFLDAEEPRPFRPPEPPKDQQALRRKLQRRLRESEVAAELALFGTSSLVAEYRLLREVARKYALDAWPTASVITLAGPQAAPLALEDWSEVWSITATLDDPDRVLDELDAWSLPPSLVAALAACYPELLAMMQEFAREGRVTRLARSMLRGEEWTMRWETEATLRVLLQMPPDAPLSLPAGEPEEQGQETPASPRLRYQLSRTPSERSSGPLAG